MKTSFWIKLRGKKTFNQWGVFCPSISVNKPVIEPKSVAVKIEIDVPDSYFEQPELSASITLPDVAEHRPQVTTEMLERVALDLSKEIGVVVHFDINKSSDGELYAEVK